MKEDLQNSSLAGNDDLLSDIPPAVVAGNDEHAAPPEEEPQPTAPPQEEPQPEKPRKAPPDTSVMKVSSFMGALVLLAIPIVNFVCAIKFVGLVIGGCVIAKYQFGYDVIQHLLDLIFPK